MAGFLLWQAVASAASLVEGSVSSELKKFLKKHIVKKELSDQLGVLDSKLGTAIREKLGITVCNAPLPPHSPLLSMMINLLHLSEWTESNWSLWSFYTRFTTRRI